MILIQQTQTGANQFSAAAPIVTFAEMTNINAQPPNVAARIIGYSYNSLGAAHDASLVLAPSAAAAANLQIVLETRTGINSFTEMCGPGGIVVPRIFGFVDGVQTVTGATYVVLFSTSGGKDNSGTFTLIYAIDDVDTPHR